ncbi:YcxB family protein [Cohnella thailandensis]
MVDFNFAYAKSSGSLRTVSLLGIVFLIYFIVQLSRGQPFGSYAFSLFFILISVLLPIMLYRGAVQSSRNKFYTEKKIYEFTPEGFRMESESSNAKVQWSDVQRVIINKHGIFLIIFSNAGHLFPQRFLEGKDGIRKMVLQYTSPQSRKKSKSKFLLKLGLYLLIFLVTVGIVQFYISRNLG